MSDVAILFTDKSLHVLEKRLDGYNRVAQLDDLFMTIFNVAINCACFRVSLAVDQLKGSIELDEKERALTR